MTSLLYTSSYIVYQLFIGHIFGILFWALGVDHLISRGGYFDFLIFSETIRRANETGAIIIWFVEKQEKIVWFVAKRKINN